MKYLGYFLIALFILTSCSENKKGASTQTSITPSVQTQEAKGQFPWTDKQLMNPAELAQKITENKIDPNLILSIGFDNIIKGSRDMGPAKDAVYLDNLKRALDELPKDSPVVIYCGCCPFNVCPNVIPAYNMMASMGFKNGKLLNLETSIKADWLDFGYPVD